MAKINLISVPENIDPEPYQIHHYANITDIESWQDLLNAYTDLKQHVVPKKVFLVLDDQNQAEYTSGHATQHDELHFDIGEYLEGVDDKKWDEVFYNQCLPLQLKHYTQQLNHFDHQKQLSDLAEKMQHYDENDLNTILCMNQNPLPVMDKEIKVKIAYVETDALKLAIMPNGYFFCDFSPFENFAILKCLENYGFEFVGLGAALLGWIKTEQFNPLKINQLMQDLSRIYPFKLPEISQLEALILENNYLILPYSESPQEYMDCY